MAERQCASLMTSLKWGFVVLLLKVVQVSSEPSYHSNNKQPSCNFFKTDSNGEILSPNYPNQYPANKECSWTIRLPMFQKIILVFEVFNLQPVSASEIYAIGCKSDHIEVFDGSNFVGKYCAGNIPPRQITTTSSTLRVVFKSDNRTTQSFQGSFRAMYAACGGYYTDTTGNFASPAYPSRFPADVQCRWKIRVPPDYVIQVKFNDFKMDGKYPCSVDYVKVLDGLNATNSELGHFCSTRPPQKSLITSTGNTMSLEFKSYKESNSRGFQAHFSRVPHCTGFLDSDYGRFSSPGYPGSRKLDKECMWLIKVSEGKTISLLFESFDVDSEVSTFSTPGYCSGDYVEVFDGTGDNDNLLGRFCTINSKPVGTVRSTGHQMFVRLKTSFKNKGKGFLASYYGMDPNNYLNYCDVFDNKLLFTCKSGKKILCQLQCDGTNDCPDASDERHCKNTASPTSQKSSDVRNYVIVILSITGSALSIICLVFIVDKLRGKTATGSGRRMTRQRRSRLRISTANATHLTEEPSSPPPPYEFIGSRNVGDAFEVSIRQPHLTVLSPPSNLGEMDRAAYGIQNDRHNQILNQALVVGSGNQSNTSTVTTHEMSAQLTLQEISQTVNTREEPEDSVSIYESTGIISPSESISSFNDTTPLIRSGSEVGP